MLAGVVIPSVGAVLDTDEFIMSRATLLKDAGRWLDAYKGGGKTIMGNSYVLVHYSQGTLNYLPYASGPLALEYIRKKHPDFISLYSKDSAPYIRDWMQSGIPDPCAREIKRFQQGYEHGGFPIRGRSFFTNGCVRNKTLFSSGRTFDNSLRSR